MWGFLYQLGRKMYAVFGFFQHWESLDTVTYILMLGTPRLREAKIPNLWDSNAGPGPGSLARPHSSSCLCH